MGRYRNANTGVTVSVRDDKTLDSEWEVIDGDAGETAKDETAGEPSADWTVKQLRAHAEGAGIELASNLTKPEILAAIADGASSAASEGDESGED